MLKQGGNAMDAAVAAGAVLGVTEPYSAGPGRGGGFMVYYDAKKRRSTRIDGRETAPRAMTATSLEGIPFDGGRHQRPVGGRPRHASRSGTWPCASSARSR